MDNIVLHRRDRLIITAIEIIDELGVQNLSTREIAKRQGVSEATLFRHYKSKNDLLAAVLDFFAQYDEDIFQSVSMKKLKPTDAITYLITSFSEYYENYPAITSITQLTDVFRYEPGLADKLKGIIDRRNEFIRQLIDEAQLSGEINPAISSEDAVFYINGMCREICLNWRLNNQSFPLCKRTMDALSAFLNLISKH